MREKRISNIRFPNGKLISNFYYEENLRFPDVLALGPDGSTIAWMDNSSEKTIHVINLNKNQEISKIQTYHYGSMAGLTFNQNGSLVASADFNDINIWDVKSGQSIGDSLSMDLGQLSAFLFTPEGYLFAGDTDEFSYWPVTPDAWGKANCMRAGRNLTKDEWEQYIYWTPYDPEYKTYPNGSRETNPCPHLKNKPEKSSTRS